MQKSIGQTIVLAALGVLLVTVMPFGAHAQTKTETDLEPLDFGPLDPEPEPPVGTIERRAESGNYTLAKRSIPLHELVRGLFPQIGHALTGIGELFLEDSLGIEKGTVQERALLTAILAAAEVEPDNTEMSRRSQELVALRSQDGANASRRRNREMMLEDARRLGFVWGRLTAGLGAGSPTMVKISAYVENRRLGMAIGSNESFENSEHMIWRMERAFQSGVSSVLSDN